MGQSLSELPSTPPPLTLLPAPPSPGHLPPWPPRLVPGGHGFRPSVPLSLSPVPVNQHPLPWEGSLQGARDPVSWDSRTLVTWPKCGPMQCPENTGVQGVMQEGRAGGDSPVAEEAALNDLHDEIGSLALSHVGAESVPGGEGGIRGGSLPSGRVCSGGRTQLGVWELVRLRVRPRNAPSRGQCL